MHACLHAHKNMCTSMYVYTYCIPINEGQYAVAYSKILSIHDQYKLKMIHTNNEHII